MTVAMINKRLFVLTIFLAFFAALVNNVNERDIQKGFTLARCAQDAKPQRESPAI